MAEHYANTSLKTNALRKSYDLYRVINKCFILF